MSDEFRLNIIRDVSESQTRLVQGLVCISNEIRLRNLQPKSISHIQTGFSANDKQILNLLTSKLTVIVTPATLNEVVIDV